MSKRYVIIGVIIMELHLTDPIERDVYRHKESLFLVLKAYSRPLIMRPRPQIKSRCGQSRDRNLLLLIIGVRKERMS